MRLPRLILAAGAFLLGTLPGEAQPERFAAAVADLAKVARVDVAQRAPMTPLIDRLTSALAEWDRSISALEARTAAELKGASEQRAFQLHVELGLALRRRGHFADALREFDAAAALVPRASDIHVLRALTFDAAGDVENTRRAFNTAWSLDPQNPIKAYYVVSYRSGTDLDRARQTLMAAYNRTLQGGKRSAPFLRLDVLGDALTSAKASVGELPIIADATLAQAFALLAASKYNEAVDALRRSRPSSSPDDSPLAHFTRAQNDEAENRVAEARRGYEAALKGTLAGRSLLYVGMGRLAQVEGDYDSAIDLLARAVRLAPNDPMAHRELASALVAGNRIDDALAELVVALLIDPGDAFTTAALGQLFLDNGRYADAVAALTRTLQLAPDRFEAHYALGAAMTHLGRTADAAREFELFERARQQMVDKRRKENGVGTHFTNPEK
jgi:tetratricopeptide (TPR) repeat protein